MSSSRIHFEIDLSFAVDLVKLRVYAFLYIPFMKKNNIAANTKIVECRGKLGGKE